MPQHAQKQAHKQAQAFPKSAELPALGRRILLVEDDRTDRLILWRTFKKLRGATKLEFAQSLGEARALLRSTRFHAAILDNALPDGKGVDFAMELAQHSRTANLPLFIVSGWPSPFMEEKASRANVRAIFTKHDFGTKDARKIVNIL